MTTRAIIKLRDKFIKGCQKQLQLIGQEDRRRWTFPYGDELALQLKFGVYPIGDVLPCEDEEDVEDELTAAIIYAKQGMYDELLLEASRKLSASAKQRDKEPTGE
ncbi:hypothetical protein D3W54_16005 (plasmid) [Komagataeibacter medellinensis]|uniref:Phage protein n=1 Tax=Komagataeibacter medellinensis TaxID=1177712 RepID=A0ABQ6VQR6_9PROT|nr:hypothetical protein [Komagataeibacter medellinensis]KAB8122212.1 hypothetical protein D3W54_16005 [Komagataeibacter medellinensis]